jgi:hypothetical protein
MEGDSLRFSLFRIEPNVFLESNPTNIKFHVYRGNAAITLICQKTPRDPILPMFSLFLSDVGVWGYIFNGSQCFPGKLERQWD